MAASITLKAFAKVNLFLEMTGKKSDGYHTLDSWFQSVSLCDYVTISKKPVGIEISCNVQGIPTDRRNIAYKAAEAFFAEAGISGGCEINIEKNIPSEAGLGGGSADGAAVLNGLNRLYGSPLGSDTLVKIGAAVGADLPFCITGGLRKASGIGEILSSPVDYPSFNLLIVKPTFGISTGGAYRQLDIKFNEFQGYTPKSHELLEAGIEAKDISKMTAGLYNCFESVLDTVCPEALNMIQTLKSTFGNCLLSGSGSAVFSLFESAEEARDALIKVKSMYPDAFACVATPVSAGTVAVNEMNNI